MKTLTDKVAKEPVEIHLFELSHLWEFVAWLEQPRTALAFDTETSGLDIYARGFELRLAQFGDRNTSWVIPAKYKGVIEYAIRTAPRLTCHNSNHDLHTIDKHLGISLEDVQPKTIDTFILSHLIDPRNQLDGGVGHGLKNLSCHYVDFFADDGDSALKEVFKANGWTSNTGWSQIDVDDETYNRYAGLDTILLARVLDKLLPLAAPYSELVKFEHKLQLVCAKMERRGLLIDVPYTEQLLAELEAEVEEHNGELVRICRELGVAPLTPRGVRDVFDATFWALSMGGLRKRRPSKGKQYVDVSSSSNQVIVQGLLAMGETLKETTPSGALSVGKDVLNALCDVNMDGERLELREPNKLAVHVKAAKRASKWAEAYVRTMLDIRDENDRIHPKISSLKARTGRMAISRPPFQQLPSSGRKIRDCLIADPGKTLISCDYDQIEMRLLAGMAREQQMMNAIADGVDLHDMTATIIFGPDFTKKQRKLSKVVGFGKVYGAGAKTIAKQTGVLIKQAKEVIDGYDQAFPGIKEYSQELQDQAIKNDRLAIYSEIMGRFLPLDADRVYAALNYQIQGTAREVFAQALVRLDEAGLSSYLLLPIHDEVLAQAPIDRAEQVAKYIGAEVATKYKGVELSAEGDVIGERWGMAYA